MSALNAERVEQLFDLCKSNGIQVTGGKVVEGIMRKVHFDTAKLAEHKKEIGDMLADLPEQFQEKGGGGWSFLNACQTKEGERWTGMHVTMDKLVMLGIATGQAKFLLDRDLWAAFPGGMPYFAVQPGGL